MKTEMEDSYCAIPLLDLDPVMFLKNAHRDGSVKTHRNWERAAQIFNLFWRQRNRRENLLFVV